MESHHSSALTKVLTQHVPDGSLVLDLGGVASGATKVLLEKKCRCYVEDLAEYLKGLKSSKLDPLVALDKHMLSTNSDVQFNMILCWDFMNYLPLDTIGHLLKKLSPHIAPGCILHFIRYREAQITPVPRQFRLLKNYTYEALQDDSKARVANQPHSKVRLLQHFDQFVLRDRVMNKQGMQSGVVEYLLQSKSGASASPVKSVKRKPPAPYFVPSSPQKTVALPALSQGLTALGPWERLSVLDIGKRAPNNAALLNRRFKHVYTEDVYASMSWQKKINGEASLNLSTGLLGLAGCSSLDLILVWDTFNYCRVDQIEGILQLLAKNLKQDTLLHLLLYRQKNIPASPSLFEVDQAWNLKMMRGPERAATLPAMHAGVVSLVKPMRNFRIVANNTIKTADTSSYQELLLSYAH